MNPYQLRFDLFLNPISITFIYAETIFDFLNQRFCNGFYGQILERFLDISDQYFVLFFTDF